jgi:biotin carboxyl carrier protein
MRPSKIRMLIKLVEESNIGELEVSSWGRKVSIRKKVGSNSDNGNHHSPARTSMPVQVPPTQSRMEQLEVSYQEPKAAPVKTDLTEIKSPMVGTFYRSPAPDAKPYLEVGQIIKLRKRVGSLKSWSRTPSRCNSGSRCSWWNPSHNAAKVLAYSADNISGPIRARIFRFMANTAAPAKTGRKRG